jgi:hypothetical protein
VAALTDGAAVEVWTAAGELQASYQSVGQLGGVVTLAIRNDGTVAAATGAGSIVLLRGGSQTVVASGGEWTALAFSSDDKDLIASEAANQEIVVIREVASNPGRTVLASLDAAPGVLAVAHTGGSVVVVVGEATDDGTGQDLAVVNAAGGVTRIACGCAASSLNALQGNLVVEVAGSGEGALLMLDADAPSARLIAVPVQSLEAPSANGGSAE